MRSSSISLQRAHTLCDIDRSCVELGSPKLPSITPSAPSGLSSAPTVHLNQTGADPQSPTSTPGYTLNSDLTQRGFSGCQIHSADGDRLSVRAVNLLPGQSLKLEEAQILRQHLGSKLQTQVLLWMLTGEFDVQVISCE